MQTKTVNTLISLFESIVFEDSTVLPVFKGNAEAEQLILALHKANKLSHNAEVVKSKELSSRQLLSLFQRLSDSGTTHMLILLKGPKAVAVTVTKSDDKFMWLDNGRLKSKGLMSGYWNYQDQLKQSLQNVIGLSGLEVYMIKQPGTYITSVRRK